MAEVFWSLDIWRQGMVLHFCQTKTDMNCHREVGNFGDKGESVLEETALLNWQLAQ